MVYYEDGSRWYSVLGRCELVGKLREVRAGTEGTLDRKLMRRRRNPTDSRHDLVSMEEGITKCQGDTESRKPSFRTVR